MKMELVQCVREHSKATGSVRTLLLNLAIYTHADTDLANPSLATLARDLHTDQTNALRVIAAAEQLGELRVERGQSGQGHANRYTVLCGSPEAHPNTSAAASVRPTPNTSAAASVPARPNTRGAATEHSRGRDRTLAGPLVEAREGTVKQGYSGIARRNEPTEDTNLYRLHGQLVGRVTTPAQGRVIDNYMLWTGNSRRDVALAMYDTPNPGSHDWLRRVGDLLRARAKPA